MEMYRFFLEGSSNYVDWDAKNPLKLRQYTSKGTLKRVFDIPMTLDSSYVEWHVEQRLHHPVREVWHRVK